MNTVDALTKKKELREFNEVRELIGRSHVASLYDRLTEQQKAMILFGAKLKPSLYISKSIDEMSYDEREEIRLSIIALGEINHVFGGGMLSREQFSHKPKRNTKTQA
ncbi:hypothetical protein [Shewanella sp. MTB7]|uniref:hypothetical protein n=1 Tax=Shewanella sp. MTB7 TaxID=2746932 RepID=UPI0022BA17D5|nr:hypothetical protein [Shewanella sp. MTB7]WBJ93541.1 hypothetical protein HWQ47_16595 [Shewanella sp. MTB7]